MFAILTHAWSGTYLVDNEVKDFFVYLKIFDTFFCTMIFIVCTIFVSFHFESNKIGRTVTISVVNCCYGKYISIDVEQHRQVLGNIWQPCLMVCHLATLPSLAKSRLISLFTSRSLYITVGVMFVGRDISVCN